MLDLQPHYAVAEHYDELYAPGGAPRPQYDALAATLAGLERGEILARVRAINTALLQRGVTFTVHANSAGTERSAAKWV